MPETDTLSTELQDLYSAIQAGVEPAAFCYLDDSLHYPTRASRSETEMASYTYFANNILLKVVHTLKTGVEANLSIILIVQSLSAKV